MTSYDYGFEYDRGYAKSTPCDFPDDDGTYRCPYEGFTGYEGERCRVCCGLGVDE